MKTINYIFLLLCFLFVTEASATEYSIDKAEALSIAKKLFTGKDVDYYLDSTKSFGSSKKWYIFVDAEPLKGWDHDCYTVVVDKTITVSSDEYTPIKIKLRHPTNSNFTPLAVKNRYGSFALERPNISYSNSNQYDIETANRTYAIILSGGVNKNANYERYWNDCSFIFQTLKRAYRIPQSNITVIMSDGTSPDEDMLTVEGKYKSSPLDLDNDGINDIRYSATLTNVRGVLNQLSKELKQDDHLFIYVIDHGGTDDYVSKSYINLWGEGDRLYDNQLADYLKPLVNKGVSVNAILGQCYSGGFVDDLSDIGCVVTTACLGNESSWACYNLLYDEFVYHWTSAINGYDTHGNVVLSDFNNDGHVTMEEAFMYARNKDVRHENPCFAPGEAGFGKYLSFKSLPKSDDIYIKDNPEDVGDEPNLTTDKPWNTPSIAVRNEQDSLCVYENPYYSKQHPYAYVYVMVHNKGKKTYRGGDFIYVNWVNASLAITANAWNGEETYNDNQTGGVLECSKITNPILPGDSSIVELGWFLPKSLRDTTEGRFHYCLYARIQDKTTTAPIPFENFRPRESKKEAQKNVTIIRKSDITKGLNVFMRNISDKTCSYSLEFVPRTTNDNKLFSMASVQMGMTPKVYSAWERGGLQAIDAEPIASSNNDAAFKRLKLLTVNNKIKEVKLNANEFDVVNLKFNFNKFSNDAATYCYDLIQRDADGNIVGGETIIIEQPKMTHLHINSNPIPGGFTELCVDDSDIENITWYDGNGETISTSPVAMVNPISQGTDFSVTAVTSKGDVAVSSISLENLYGIREAVQSADELIVNLKTGAFDNSSIETVSLLNGTVMSTVVVPYGVTSVSVNTSSIPKGSYLVRYLVGSEIIDTAKVILK